MAAKVSVRLEVPLGEDTVLLHTCCAPCSSAILECMTNQGIKPVIFYSNSNIYPYEEYDHRRSECARYAAKLGVEMVEDEYDHDAWLEAVRGLENEPERGGRCLKCFKYRLGRAARYASEHGYKVLTTTLASSRWKRLDQINEAGLEACAAFGGMTVPQCDLRVRDSEVRAIPLEGVQGVEKASRHMTPVIWWDQNWRKGGLQERRGEIIREMGFYNQQWCGCEFSIRPEQKDL